ncbi:MAG TPA: hypothetical protein VGP63_23955 [Planctomycetaceae bacterium]|nr:hypothetical protein [Planctomycetaceae bacterium]
MPSPEDGAPPAEFTFFPTRRFWVGAIVLLAAVGMIILVVAAIGQRVRKVAGPNGQPGPMPFANPRPQGFVNRPPQARPMPARPIQPQQMPGRPMPAVVRNRPPRNDGEGAPLRPVPWTVVADPPRDMPSVPANLSVRIPIPKGPNPEIVFPTTPSRMVSVGQAGHGQEQREIWDYATNRKIGDARGLKTLSADLGGFFRPVSALSADGHFFVTQGVSPLELLVWDVIAGRQFAIREPKHAPTCSLTFAAFARPDLLLVGGIGMPFQRLGVASPTTRDFRRFPREHEFDRTSLAISPGGRFLAVFDKSRLVLRFYKVELLVPAGQLPLPPFEPAGPMNCECVAFSPDGGEVAALFSYNSRWHLACWDLGDKKLVDRIDFEGNLRATLGAPFAYLFAPLEWFPGQQRWLVYGQGIVDRHAGKLIWKIPDEPNRYRYGIRHVASDDCVLSVVKDEAGLVLASIPLPLADIDRAAQLSPPGKALPPK